MRSFFSDRLRWLKAIIFFLLLAFFSFHGYLRKGGYGLYIRDIVERDGPLVNREASIGFLKATEQDEGGGYLHDGYDRLRIRRPYPFKEGDVVSAVISFNEKGEGELLFYHVHQWRVGKHVASLLTLPVLIALCFLNFRFDRKKWEFFLRE